MSNDRLDVERILNESFVARVEHYLTLPSTNDRATQAATENAARLPLLVVADEQTAGRGRGTNRWWTGRGSLAFSLLVDAQWLEVTRPSQSPLISLAAAVAVVETVAPWLSSVPLGICWPNDVWAGGGKLAGILVEALSNGLCVVGIGINTNNSPAEAPPEVRDFASTLRQLTGSLHDQTELLIDLLRRLENAFKQLAAQPPQIAARADELCLQHGRTLTLELGSRTIVGVCAGIAADGALLLDTPAGRKTCYSGVLR